jgi:hypothetical protein
MPGGRAAAIGQEEAVHGLAVDVELELVGGLVADPDGPGAAVAGPVLQVLLEVRRPVDAVHDLQPVAAFPGSLGDPVPEP